MERQLVRQEQRWRQPLVRPLLLVLVLPQVRLLFWAINEMVVSNMSYEYNNLAFLLIVNNDRSLMKVEIVAVITLATSFETMQTIKSVSEIPKDDTV